MLKLLGWNVIIFVTYLQMFCRVNRYRQFGKILLNLNGFKGIWCAFLSTFLRRLEIGSSTSLRDILKYYLKINRLLGEQFWVYRKVMLVQRVLILSTLFLLFILCQWGYICCHWWASIHTLVLTEVFSWHEDSLLENVLWVGTSV